MAPRADRSHCLLPSSRAQSILKKRSGGSAAFTAGHAATITLAKDMGDLTVPKGYRQAMTSPQSSYWREAIAKEIRGLLQLDTWEYVLHSSLPTV